MYLTGHNKPKSEQANNPSAYPQGWFKNKPCKKCSEEFTPKSPGELYCSDKCKTSGNVDKYLLRTYGITMNDHNTMYREQDGLCKICNTSGFVMKKCHKIKLVVDHCHTTGVVRGLLCHNCNRALGLLHDDIDCLDRAKEYLKVQRLSVRSTPKQAEAVGPQ